MWKDGFWALVGSLVGGCGEVLKQHLTIGKADEQVDSELFGEVLSCFSS